MSKLFTIGYGGRKPGDFIQLLTASGVQAIADVRMNPTRASMGSYILAKSSDKGIQKLLNTAAIEYVSLAESLGNPDPKDPEMKVYRTEVAGEFGERTRELIKIAQENPTALLCAEKRHRECHRTIIAEYFESLGWTIEHLE